MATADSRRAHDFPTNAPRYLSRQLQNDPPNAQQLEGRQEDVPPPVRGAGRGGPVPGAMQEDPAHYINAAYHQDPAYIFPDAGYTQGVPAQVQPNVMMNQGHDIPNRNQQTEDLRGLASRYWYHPNSEVGGISVEMSNTGRYKVMIILDV